MGGNIRIHTREGSPRFMIQNNDMPLSTSIRERGEIAQTLFNFFLAINIPWPLPLSLVGVLRASMRRADPVRLVKNTYFFHKSLSSVKYSTKEVVHFVYRGFLNHCVLNGWKQF